ncbi:Dyp-type peroxidase [Variovorax sp. LARHSF232]
MKQAFITILIPFESALTAAVEACIDAKLGNPPNAAVRRALGKRGIVHFMSLLVVPGPASHPAHLLLEASADGTRDEAIGAIAADLRAPMLAVLGSAQLPAPPSLEELLRGHARSIGQAWWETLGLEFAGTPGMSVRRIRMEDALARRLAAILQGLPHALAPYARLEVARNRLWREGHFKWAFEPESADCLEGAPDSGITPYVTGFFGDAIPARPFDPLPALRTVTKIAADALVAIAWPVVLLGVALWWAAARFMSTIDALLLVGAVAALVAAAVVIRLRRLELANTPEDHEPGSQEVETVMRHESHAVQNLLFSVSGVQAGLLRRSALRLAFFSVGLVGYFCRPGFLGGNRVIHFARWLVVPGTNQLVFLSNYDGTWQGYVGDFVINTAGAKGVTSIWSNCLGFPRTLDLFDEGAADRDRLVRWARRQQRPVHFWYSAYRWLTTDRIRANAAIRQGLANASTAQDARDWLACFGSISGAPQPLDADEIPALAFGGLSRLRHACVAGFRLHGDSWRGRAWLRDMQPLVSYGEEPKRRQALAIGLSATGLRRLGLHDAEDLSTFPVAYQQGMAAPERARANGDVQGQAPQHWRWGLGERAVDVVVMLFADDPAGLALQLEALRLSADLRGHAEVLFQEFLPLPSSGRAVEAFGFVDGVSQPAMRGTRRAETVAPRDVIAPGEIVLGYRDELGRCGPSSTLHASRDPGHHLGDAGVDPSRQRPLFKPAPGASAPRDFGHNGTFLVVRELEQHVDAFNAWIEAQAPGLRGNDVPLSLRERREWLAAKLVGRWRDGSSLLRYPERPAGGWWPPHKHKRVEPDNAFLYGQEDPAGMRCPIGAHIRRANPRDGLALGAAETAAAVQTHRLLRVGRSYRTPQGRQGLMFMCVNVDIERQFEFVQQRWILNSSFEALRDESDALLGRGARGLSIPGCPARRPAGMQDFVTMRGGGYFFLPSRAALQVLALAQ